jgi:uncharacterized protein (TIGR00730 family)
MKRVCVFCGSSLGRRDEYRFAARNLAQELAGRKIGLVYGGGRVGLMGELADAATAAGGEVIGVIPRPLISRELAHPRLSELHTVENIHDRKTLMADLADAFIALPGGYGTLEESFEVLSWAGLGLHAKPFGLLDVAGYYQPLLRFLDLAVAEGFLSPKSRALLVVEPEPARLVDALVQHRPRGRV